MFQQQRRASALAAQIESMQDLVAEAQQGVKTAQAMVRRAQRQQPTCRCVQRRCAAGTPCAGMLHRSSGTPQMANRGGLAAVCAQRSAQARMLRKLPLPPPC